MIWSTAERVDKRGASIASIAIACPRVSEHPRLALSWISRSRFESILDGLLERGVRFLDLDDFRRQVEDPSAEASGGILLTFEDADENFLHRVAPLLHEREIPAVLFVATASVGHVEGRSFGPFRRETPQLSWSQLRKLRAWGIRTQSAGHHVLDLRSVPPEVAFGDLIRSRRELERRLSEEAVALSYPHRAVDEEIADLARRAGFALAFGGGEGKLSDPLMDLPRMALRPSDSADGVLRRMEKQKARREQA